MVIAEISRGQEYQITLVGVQLSMRYVRELSARQYNTTIQ